MSTIRVAAISGSLRRDSFNTALIENSKRLAPEGMLIERIDISLLPLYNMDLEAEMPEAVLEFHRAVRHADAVLFASPEHNFSYSGVLKNAIDWGSRPPQESVWNGKPVIVQSASPGWAGGIRGQYHLFQVLGYFEMHHIRFPEVVVGQCKAKFDESLLLTDELAIENIKKQLAKLAEVVRGDFSRTA